MGRALRRSNARSTAIQGTRVLIRGFCFNRVQEEAMALGHTAKVRSGEITDLRDYALLSLRAWRSAEGEVEIDYDLVTAEEQPNPYYARKLEEAQSRLGTLKAMT